MALAFTAFAHAQHATDDSARLKDIMDRAERVASIEAKIKAEREAETSDEHAGAAIGERNFRIQIAVPITSRRSICRVAMRRPESKRFCALAVTSNTVSKPAVIVVFMLLRMPVRFRSLNSARELPLLRVTRRSA
jgi:hypothetical protein